MSVDNLFSEEQILAMRAAAGGPSPSSSTPKSEWHKKVDIRLGNQKVGQPNIRNAQGELIETRKVKGPSDTFMRDNAARRLKEIEEENAARAVAKALQEASSPDRVDARLAYLERTVKSLQKDLKTLKNKTNDS